LKLVAVAVFACLLGSVIAVLGSGATPRAEWEEIDHTVFFVGVALFAVAVAIAYAVRAVRPGWRADREFGERARLPLLLLTVACLLVGLGIGLVQVLTR
jgi:hypothetical protein